MRDPSVRRARAYIGIFKKKNLLFPWNEDISGSESRGLRQETRTNTFATNSYAVIAWKIDFKLANIFAQQRSIERLLILNTGYWGEGKVYR